MNATEKIIAWFKENGDVFNACVEELDCYNGYLGDERFYPMEELNEFYCNTEPIELLQCAFFGHDGETWTTNNDGTRNYSEFNPNRDYFTFNGYGNLVSYDYIDYSDKLDKYAIKEIQENRQYIDTIDSYPELSELFDELEEETEEE